MFIWADDFFSKNFKKKKIFQKMHLFQTIYQKSVQISKNFPNVIKNAQNSFLFRADVRDFWHFREKIIFFDKNQLKWQYLGLCAT